MVKLPEAISKAREVFENKYPQGEGIDKLLEFNTQATIKMIVKAWLLPVLDSANPIIQNSVNSAVLDNINKVLPVTALFNPVVIFGASLDFQNSIGQMRQTSIPFSPTPTIVGLVVRDHLASYYNLYGGAYCTSFHSFLSLQRNGLPLYLAKTSDLTMERYRPFKMND